MANNKDICEIIGPSVRKLHPSNLNTCLIWIDKKCIFEIRITISLMIDLMFKKSDCSATSAKGGQFESAETD